LIVEKDIKRANHIFNKYVGLLRTTVFNADNIRISLQEEINFIKDYLDLEKFRYHDKFLYKINIDEKIDMQMLVPKMSVHLFVENAIKHGLRHLDKGGLLEIEAIRKHNEVHLTIADNGVGREKAKKYATFSTGKGLHIMDKILENYFNLYRVKISYKIIDLFENNKAAGTRIEIKIPLE
jgi:LytS/YehU family sensor histidine kinase